MLSQKMIGNKIAEARKRINISQAQMAEQLFISPQAVGKWERGESMPDILTFNRLAEILGVDLNYFTEGNTAVTGKTPIVEPLIQSVEEMSPALPKNKLSWDMSRGNWVDADFSGLNNLHEKFNTSNMQRCKFIGSDLSVLHLKSNFVDNCDFSGSNLSKCTIQSSHLNSNIFKDCSMKETSFSRNHINACDFSGADLSGAEFHDSFINGCNFTGADFTGVKIKSGGLAGMVSKKGDTGKDLLSEAIWNSSSFIDTQIADIEFSGTLENCYFENCAFTRLTFRNARLLNTFFKNNRKLNRVQFVDCQADRITYEFLKQGQADLSGITLVANE